MTFRGPLFASLITLVVLVCGLHLSAGYLNKKALRMNNLISIETNLQNVTEPTAILLPLYGNPTSGLDGKFSEEEESNENNGSIKCTNWEPLLEAKKKYSTVEVLGIVSIEIGQDDYTSSAFCIQQLNDAGIKVLGYVFTKEGNTTKRAEYLKSQGLANTTVQQDIDNFKKYYPGLLQGVFVDEFADDLSNMGTYQYYKDIQDHIKATGYSISVANPGVPPNFGSNPRLFDILMIWEDFVYPTEKDLEGYTNDRSQNSVIVHSQTSFDQQKVINLLPWFEYIYIDGTNNYGEVSPYISDLFALLSSN